MYFVHPQIKLNSQNLKNLFFSFLKSPEEREIEKLKVAFPQKELIFTDMGRTAFKLIVEKLGLQNSQILLPAYICDIFFPIFKEYKLSPIFLDIERETFQMNLDLIEKKITKKTRAILICHTYGLPVNIKKIETLAKKYNLKIIEDCAHSFGSGTGNSGDASLFSLYKQFPSLRGGMAIIRKQKTENRNQKSLAKTSFNLRDFISLLNSFNFFAFLFKKFGGKIAPKMIRSEKSKKISQVNKVSLNLFLYFSKNFKEEIKKRIELAIFFQEKLKKLGFEVQNPKNNVFCYLSALVPKNMDRDEFVERLRKYGIFCTRIWKDPIILNPEVQKEYNLNLTEFPNTIEVAKRIVNFPLQNFYIKNDIEKMILAIKKCLSSNDK